MGDISIMQLAGPDARRARIRKLCQNHAWRFHALPGSEARYVIEAYVPGATPEDRAYAECYISATPQLFDGTWPQLQPRDVADRDAACSARLVAEAATAAQTGEYRLALAMIDDGEWFGFVARADDMRSYVRDQLCDQMRAARTAQIGGR